MADGKTTDNKAAKPKRRTSNRTAAQTRTDEQIRLLLDRDGAAKPRRKATKTAKKKAAKKVKRN